MSEVNRQLTDHERRLVRWMLEHGSPEAAAFLPQLDHAEVTPWKCDCGCASITFQIRGHPDVPPGVQPIAEFVFVENGTLSGIFIYEKNGILGGLEVYGLEAGHLNCCRGLKTRGRSAIQPPHNITMHRRREAGSFQIDNHSSRPGDCGRYVA